MFHKTNAEEFKQILKKHPQLTTIDIMLPDLLGIVRGKKISSYEFENFFQNGVRMPKSVYVLDSAGRVCQNLPFAVSDGDPDYNVYGQAGSFALLNDKTGMLFGFMDSNQKGFCEYDCRSILKKQIESLEQAGFQAAVGMEFEFYLLKYDKDHEVLQKAHSDSNSLHLNAPNIYSLDTLDSFSELFDEVGQLCLEHGIKVQTMISEAGTCQYEVTLAHEFDLLKACDHAIMLKRFLKNAARKRGNVCCFLAKPFKEEAGSGLHIHVSLLDKKTGKNVFAGNEFPELGTPCSKQALYAIHGLLETMSESIAVFAPNANSYRRFKSGTFAPVNKAWGSNNRTVAIRLPFASEKSARIEHRVSGSDANPYLSLSMILAGILEGLALEKEPQAFSQNNAYAERGVEGVPSYWSIALLEFAKSSFIPKHFGKEFHNTYLKNREFECSEFHSEVSYRDYDWYLPVV